jgi:hypothetical protein
MTISTTRVPKNALGAMEADFYELTKLSLNTWEPYVSTAATDFVFVGWANTR